MIPKQRYAMLNNYKKMLLLYNPLINNNAGIYFFTRAENGFKFAYVGQAKHLISRLAEHFVDAKQHIDLSLKKRKLYSKENPTGWNINFVNCEEFMLDKLEQEAIKKYADMGYQLYNKTGGSQGSDKFGLTENTERKGYRQGVEYGELKARRLVKEYFDKYLDFVIKPKSNKVKERKYNEFKQYLEGTDNG